MKFKTTIAISILFISCKNTETYKIAEMYLKNDTAIISKLGTDKIENGKIISFSVDAPLAAYELHVKDKNGEYKDIFILLKTKNEKWICDTILYEPNETVKRKVFDKYF